MLKDIIFIATFNAVRKGLSREHVDISKAVELECSIQMVKTCTMLFTAF